MQPLFQSARPHLPGPAFLDLLHRFRNDPPPLTALYSADHHGHSVLARKPLLTLTAPDEHSPLQIHTSLTFPPTPAASGIVPQLPDLLEQLTTSLPPITPHHPLTAYLGQIAYDIARTLEHIGTHALNDLHWPLLHWQLFDEYFLLDHTRHTWTLITTHWPNRPESPETRLNAMATHLAAANPTPLPTIPPPTLLNSLPRATYLEKIHRLQNYIAAGDIFQANFAQRWQFHTPAHPIDLFHRLTHESPAPYAALLLFDNKAAISASPELLLSKHGTHLRTRPIKGTRPRDLLNPAHDQQLHHELLHSPKDQAELAMIVDLLRNDLGRVARYGSVHVETPRTIEKHPTVWHAVATITAELPHSEFTTQHSEFPPILAPLLRALLPGGSITGAPKIRAMQLLEQLEPTRRGLYCGTIGALSPHAATLNIPIRTLQLIHHIATLHAGGGIVADSNPEAEHEETLHKAAAMFRALNAPPPY